MKSDTRVTHSFYCKYRMLDFWLIMPIMVFLTTTKRLKEIINK